MIIWCVRLFRCWLRGSILFLSHISVLLRIRRPLSNRVRALGPCLLGVTAPGEESLVNVSQDEAAKGIKSKCFCLCAVTSTAIGNMNIEEKNRAQKQKSFVEW